MKLYNPVFFPLSLGAIVIEEGNYDLRKRSPISIFSPSEKGGGGRTNDQARRWWWWDWGIMLLLLPFKNPPLPTPFLSHFSLNPPFFVRVSASQAPLSHRRKGGETFQPISTHKRMKKKLAIK